MEPLLTCVNKLPAEVAERSSIVGHLGDDLCER